MAEELMSKDLYSLIGTVPASSAKEVFIRIHLLAEPIHPIDGQIAEYIK